MRRPTATGEGVEHVTIVEDRRDARWVVAFLAVFVVVGVPASLVALASGAPLFVLPFAALFVAMPLAWIRRTRRQLRRADFVVSPYGVHGADAAEDDWVPWGDAVAFVWRRTGEEINDQPLWVLHLLRGDGSTVRLASVGCRSDRHEGVERQLQRARASRLVPDAVAVVRAGAVEPPAWPAGDADT